MCAYNLKKPRTALIVRGFFSAYAEVKNTTRFYGR